MGPPRDFGLAVLISRVLEAWELGNRGLYRKYWPYIKFLKKSKKFKILFWSRESKKPMFTIFSSETSESGNSKIAIFSKIATFSENRNFRKSQAEVKPRSSRIQAEVKPMFEGLEETWTKTLDRVFGRRPETPERSGTAHDHVKAH